LQGCDFNTDLKVIPLQHFDMILGYDWPEAFSPMKVHWGAKWMIIPYEFKNVMIHGILSKLQEGVVVQVYQLSEEDLHLDVEGDRVTTESVPLKVQTLLDQYSDIFATQVQFPLDRPYNHSIPFGAWCLAI
jgi:hypothetical protein